MTVHYDVVEHLLYGVTWIMDPRIQHGEKNTAIMGPPFSNLWLTANYDMRID